MRKAIEAALPELHRRFAYAYLAGAIAGAVERARADGMSEAEIAANLDVIAAIRPQLLAAWFELDEVR